MAERTAREVLEDHLRLAREGNVDEDLARNYAPDVVLLTGRGVYRGHEGARRLARMLMEELPGARFAYVTVAAEGDVGFLEWTGAGAEGRVVRDGADSFVVRGGRIVAQTIHYTVEGGA